MYLHVGLLASVMYINNYLLVPLYVTGQAIIFTCLFRVFFIVFSSATHKILCPQGLPALLPELSVELPPECCVANTPRLHLQLQDVLLECPELAPHVFVLTQENIGVNP